VEPPDAPPFAALAIALFIGALIGLEREKRQADEIEAGLRKQRGLGGLRTFILLAEAGAVAAWLTQQLATPWVFVGVGAMVTAIVVAGYAALAREEGQLGLTTEAAALVTYLLGGAVLLGHASLAVALGIATSAVLAFRRPLHGLVARVGRDDLYAGLKLLVATFVVLPVLPDRPIDPWGALNPYRIWWLVVLISSLSLLGYAATRAFGSRLGIPITGLAGGLVSSTAVTLALARRSVERGADARLDHELASGILLAWATMFARVAVLVAAVNAPLLGAMGWPLAALVAVAGATAAWHHRASQLHGAGREDGLPVSNPFSLVPAMRFAVLFAGVLLAVKGVERFLPAGTLYAVAALAGLTDVDAITLSLARPGGTSSPTTATTAIGVALLVNTLAKCGMAAWLGSDGLRRHVAGGTLALLAAGAAALVLARVAS
jgi:uncharacterized membrane protein (DUF4010 family)